jgi:hypoxanthine phosphoribosyltransferase
MAEGPVPILPAAAIARLVEAQAEEIAPRIDDDTVAVCLLTGGLWFAADLTRALGRLGRHPAFDAMWLASYHDERASTGTVLVRAGLQRSVEGRRVLLLDDVFDSGLSLRESVRLCTEAGAAEVLSAVFARKPWPKPRLIEPDFIAWEAPSRYLVGYGMDAGARYRGLADICTLD